MGMREEFILIDRVEVVERRNVSIMFLELCA